MGFSDFMDSVDALLMGRTTFETVLGFNVPWPYSKPVYVLSTKDNVIPNDYSEKAFQVKGSLNEVLDYIHSNGHFKLYIDGGRTIQSFLEADLIDEMVISRLPILIGGGSPLFGNLPKFLEFELQQTEVLLGHIVKSHYIRKK
jgi:dihydrofolate reductase